MRTISAWAFKNVWPARLAIIAGYLLLNIIGFFVGDALQLFNIAIPLWAFYTSAVIFGAVFLLYPDKKYKHLFKNFYGYRKTCDLILCSTTFFFIVCLGNNPQKLLGQGITASFATTVTSIRPTEKTVSIQPLLKKLSKKTWKHVLAQKILKLRKEYKQSTQGQKIALIILSVLVALALLLLVASLSCSISCSGADGAAILVAILGVSLITFLLIKVIKRINHGPKKPQEPVTEAAKT